MNKRRAARRGERRPPSAEALVFSLLGTAEAVEGRLEAAVRPLGLSLAKAGVLMLLAQAEEPVPLHELAAHEGCVRSNITQLVDRLELDGLVRRRGDPTDRRSVRAMLTPAGEQAYGRAVRALAQEQRAIVSALSATEVTSLRGALRALARSHAAPPRRAPPRQRNAPAASPRPRTAPSPRIAG